jgi:hypothetical protein
MRDFVAVPGRWQVRGSTGGVATVASAIALATIRPPVRIPTRRVGA